MILGLMGKAGSGKDTVGRILMQHRGAQTISLADPLKRFCKEVFDFTDLQLWGPSEERNRPDLRYVRGWIDPGDADTRPKSYRGQPFWDPAYLTPRYALQTLGTEWGRDCYPDVWIDCAVRRALALGGLVVITDCRFANEAARIQQAGGEVWRIVRPGAGLGGAAGGHVSETEQDTVKVDAEVFNDGTIDQLIAQVQALADARGVQ